ncbi:MAG TPA: helix-turn-helix domain-containing protein [Alphaproteobacteria bacterium]|nr:helix-turn-helix domain-containing protein [Alphaproteobacteria bacterium]
MDEGASISAPRGAQPPIGRLSGRSQPGAGEIAQAYRRGLGVEAIARRTGVPVREVYWMLGRENVAIRPARVARGPKPETLELLRCIRRLRDDGHTYKQIARLCGIAPGTVGVMLSTFREVEL